MANLRVYEVETFDTKGLLAGKHLVAATKRKVAEKYIDSLPSYRQEGSDIKAERVLGLKYKFPKGETKEVAVYLRQVE